MNYEYGHLDRQPDEIKTKNPRFRHNQEPSQQIARKLHFVRARRNFS